MPVTVKPFALKLVFQQYTYATGQHTIWQTIKNVAGGMGHTRNGQ